MEQLISSLKEVMKAEKDAYIGLLRLSEKKKDVLVKNEVLVLNQIVQEEMAYLKAIKPLSAERESILKQITQTKGIEGSLSMDTVISFANGRIKHELEYLKQDFNEVVSKLSQYNELNNKLIDTQIQYTSFCIEMLTQNSASADTYNNAGTVASNSSRFGLIDQKA